MFLRLVDTNILYDAFTHNQNTDQAIQIVDQPICVFEGVLYELSNLLKNTTTSQFAVETIQDILENTDMFQILNSTPEDTLKALQIMSKYQTQTPKKDFSLCDSIQLVLAIECNLTLFTTAKKSCL